MSYRDLLNITYLGGTATRPNRAQRRAAQLRRRREAAKAARAAAKGK